LEKFSSKFKKYVEISVIERESFEKDLEETGA
jgi:hypothetical protein